MKLYELPRNSKFITPDDGCAIHEVFNFHHIDGMYSYCTNDKDEVFHLGASTEVEQVK